METCWFKMKLCINFIALILVALNGGCLKSDTKAVNTEINYFDIKTFFEGEVDKLNTKNPTINKIVWINNITEKKQIKINNWETELSLFTNSDINKSAWKNSYNIDSTASKITYTAKVADLKTRSIIINTVNKKPVSITIINHQKNYIFESWENLFYRTNVGYKIEKKQQLLFWDAEVFKVEARFK